MSPTRQGVPSAAAIAAAEAPAPGMSTGRRRRNRLLAFAIPSTALVLVFFFAPLIANVYFAFTQWTGFSDVIKPNGLANFKLLQQLGILSHAIAVTAIYAVVAMVVQNTVSLSLASALQTTNRVNTFFRGLFFIPVLISPLAAGYIWSAVLSPTGPLNGFLSTVLPGEHHFAWLGHGTTALIAVASVDAWKWSGLITLVYIAGLNGIPRSVIEAATIDGTSTWRRFWSIKFPLLAPAFTFNIVVTLVGAFSAFDVVFATTTGGPGDATTVLNVAVFRQYGQGNFGSASALSLVVTVMVILTAVPLIAYLRRREVQA
jgi:raffinose/stachyose/melibiose transport system permease protein